MDHRVDFRKEGEDLIRDYKEGKLDLGPHVVADSQWYERPNGSVVSISSLYTDEKTGATVYVGDLAAAECREELEERDITSIVNCQDEESVNAFEGEGGFVYLRFPVEDWEDWNGGAIKRDPRIAIEYFEGVFAFIDEALQSGRSALVHCYAGAHRAGTTAVGYLMHKKGLCYGAALIEAKGRRPVINPIFYLEELLTIYEEGRRICSLPCQD